MVMSVNCEPGRKSEQRMGGLPERAFEYYYARVGIRQNDSSSNSCNEEVHIHPFLWVHESGGWGESKKSKGASTTTIDK